MTTMVKANAQRAQMVLASLRQHAEHSVHERFAMVYLDNAKPADMCGAAFAGYLSGLERANLYRRVDGYAWGEVYVG